MDASEPSLKTDTELALWTNSIKSSDSTELSLTVLSLKGIRNIIIKNRIGCQQNWAVVLSREEFRAR